MPRHPVGPERHDGVGIDLRHDRLHLLGSGLVQVGLHVDIDRAVQEPMLTYAEDLERTQEFGGAYLAHRGRGPPLLIHRTAFAPRGGDVDDPVACRSRRGHDPGARVDIVIRVRPHEQHRAQRVHRSATLPSQPQRFVPGVCRNRTNDAPRDAIDE